MKETQSIRSLTEAVDYFDAVMSQHPERNGFDAYAAALAGKRRPYSGLVLNHLGVPGDTMEIEDDIKLPEVTTPKTPVGDLARDIINMLESLKMLNPVTPSFGLGQGSESMACSFGIPLLPEAQFAPAFHKTIDQLLAEPPPDTERSGLFPEMRERIELIKANLPPRFKISFPGLQGPFNIAHAIAGSEVFMTPYDDEKKWHALMERITTFWIDARQTLIRWIGEDRLSPTPYTWQPCITECSCNLISADFYKEFVLPHDQRLASVFGPMHIHPCSGPHIFYATIENLPVSATEAGYIAQTAAGAISVDDALAAINGRPILLFIGQELPENREYEFICHDFDRYRTNPRLTFGYTGMHWRMKDRPRIREMHRRLDDYWARMVKA